MGRGENTKLSLSEQIARAREKERSKEAGLQGKTIEKASLDGRWVTLKFTDGTEAEFEAENMYEYDETPQPTIEVTLNPPLK